MPFRSLHPETSTIPAWMPRFVLVAALASFYAILAPVKSADYHEFMVPWLRAIEESPGLSVFATGFSNYAGLYLAIMAAFAWLGDLVGDLATIKAIAVCGSVICALACTVLAAELGVSRRALATVPLAFMVMPTVMLNGVAFGQADAWYAASILGSLVFVLRGRLAPAVLLFSLAFSLKLQAVFFGPFLLGALLVRSRNVLYLSMLPPVYFASNALLLIAGRPVGDVATIYLEQFNFFHSFSLNAPNPYYFVDLLRNAGVLPIPDTAVNQASMILTAIAMMAGLAVAWFVRGRIRRGADKRTIVVLALFTVFLVPLMLPKMHDRYFFVAECLLFVLACRWREWIFPAVLVQVAVSIAYLQFHDPSGLLAPISGPASMAISVMMVLAAFHLVCMEVFRAHGGGARPPREPESDPA